MHKSWESSDEEQFDMFTSFEGDDSNNDLPPDEGFDEYEDEHELDDLDEEEEEDDDPYDDYEDEFDPDLP